ncbi:MAG: helix-turn-helix domain-containing protein [Polyangiaceae bacterium]
MAYGTTSRDYVPKRLSPVPLNPGALVGPSHAQPDDEHHARLRETLLIFLDTGGSYKATAERLVLHKNTVQYRIHKAEESLGRPVGHDRHDVELALQASHWLGSSVLQAPAGKDLAGR